MGDEFEAASTDAIRAACSGDRVAREQVARGAWERLRRRAHASFSRWRVPAWLGPPTACVGAALMRVFGRSRARWSDRAQFTRCVEQILEHVVIEQRRLGGAVKRGGRMTFEPLEDVAAERDLVADLAARESLAALAALDAESYRMVEMSLVERRTHAEIAARLGRTPRSVEHRISDFLARARRRIGGER